MAYWQVMVQGAAGGALFEALTFFQQTQIWISARRTTGGRVKENPPSLFVYLDPPAQSIDLGVRAVLGAAAACLAYVSHKAGGGLAYAAVGYSGPAVLLELVGTQYRGRAIRAAG